jgi:protein TonB
MIIGARDPDDAGRLTLALALALVLHAALLLGVPAERWSIRLPEPPRFQVILLPPPPASAPRAPPAEPEPAMPEPMPGPPATASETALPTPQPVPALAAPPPAPLPALSPAPAPPPEPTVPGQPAPPLPSSAPTTKPTPRPPAPPARSLAKPVPPATRPAPRSPAPPATPSRPTKTARSPRVAIAPVAPPKPAEPPEKPATESRGPAIAGSREPAPSRSKPDFSATAQPAPVAPESAGATRRPETGPGARETGSGTRARGRLDSGALLGQIAGLEAETQRRANAGVRGKRVSPGDTQSPEGFYIAAWIRKVERIGEMNFPDIARKLNVSAGPVLDVAIGADGSLKDIRIVRSSGHPELDRAARRIVELGAPYAPFPPQLRQKYDVLYIARPWRFEPGGRWQAR